MARHKSGFRKRLNGRWLRWRLARWFFRVVPLGRRYSFPLSSATATETTSRVIERTHTLHTGEFTPAQIERVVRPALANDKIRAKHAAVGASHFLREIAIIPDCAVLGHVGALTRMSDGAVLYAQAGRVPNWNLAKPRKLKPRPMGAGLVTSLLDTQQYFHFFEKLLPLLHYLDVHHPAGRPLQVLVPAKRPAFQRPVCEAVEAAHPGVEFVGLAASERAEIENYLWLHDRGDNAEWLSVSREAARRLATLMRAHYAQPRPRGGELLFVCRGDTRLRRLTNEKELEAIATRLGFRRFEAVADDHAGQVRAFSNAEVIVAVHGAGLTNLLFARPETAVIEIFPENFIKSTYLWLANRLGLAHFPLVGSQGNYDQAFHVDPALFAAKLDEALAFMASRHAMEEPSLAAVGHI